MHSYNRRYEKIISAFFTNEKNYLFEKELLIIFCEKFRIMKEILEI